MKFRLWIKKSLFYWNTIHKANNELLHGCLIDLVEQGEQDSWMHKILLIEHHLETNIASLTKRKIVPLIRRLASLEILEEKQHLKLMVCLSQPMVWFTLQKHVNGS